MKETRVALVFVLALAMTLSALAAAKATAKTTTLRGEVLDLACYVNRGAKGPEHAECAKMCAMRGEPMGLLTDDGAVYVLIAPHDAMQAYNQAKSLAGQKVEITGEVAEHSGVKGLEVEQIKAM